MALGAGATVLSGAVDLGQTADTEGLAEVDVTGDGGGADVEPGVSGVRVVIIREEKGGDCMLNIVPVGVLGRELLGGGGLDSVNPGCGVSKTEMSALISI